MLLSGILDYTDAAIGKVEKLSDDVKQYQSERADQEIERVVELMAPAVLSNVAEQEYQYGAEAFEAQQEEAEKAMTKDNTTKNVPVKSGKIR